MNDTRERDAQILDEYKSVGDASRLAKKYGVEACHIYRLLHQKNIAAEVARASEYANAAMVAGSVVYALPAKTLQTSAGTDAIVAALESAIKNAGNDLGVYIAIAVIPVEEIEGTPSAEPLIYPRGIAARLQAKIVKALRGTEVPA